MTSQPLDDLLDWYIAVGADEAIGETPFDRFAAQVAAGKPATAPEAPSPVLDSGRRITTKPPILSRDSRSLATPVQAIAAAAEAAAAATTIEALGQAVAAFDLCPLKATATNTVFADGNPDSRLMLIGEAPGGDEDRIGRPFVGVSGQLLDRMLAAIGRDRSAAYITNVVFWRPPGNRRPTETEVAICRPFVERHIALAAPRIIVIVGGTASAALLPGSEGITKLRGRWLNLPIKGIDRPIQAIAMYHPSFLLRSPERKRETWRDMLEIKSRMKV